MKHYKYGLFLFLLFIMPGNVYSQDVPYVPTPYEVVEGMLNMAQVTENDVVYDLGCGDGRIVVTAAKNFGASGFGVDSNPQRIQESNDNAKANKVTDKVKFAEQNLFETDLSGATVVTLYLLSDVNIRLRPKLFKELKPGTRVVSNSFDMDEWEPDEQKVVSGRNLYLWIIPVNATGTWEWTGKSGNADQKYVLTISQMFQHINGDLKIGSRSYNIKNAKLNGNRISFTADMDEGPFEFEGTIDGNELKGTVKGRGEITAKRDPGTKRELIQTASK
jgi:precorrin-6B methylase 2